MTIATRCAATCMAIAAVAVAALCVRLPFAAVGLTPDDAAPGRALSDPNGPVLVVLYQPLAEEDPSRRLQRRLAAHYVADRRAPPGLPPILARRRL